MAEEPTDVNEPKPLRTYLGEEVGSDFYDLLVRVYSEQYQAAHPDHAPPSGDTTAILALCEAAGVTGGPDACALGRQHAIDPPVAP